MIYVFEGGSIVYDGNSISEEEKAQAVAVEVLPVPEVVEGKVAILRANKAEDRVYYEYADMPKEPEIESLKQSVAELSAIVAAMSTPQV